MPDVDPSRHSNIVSKNRALLLVLLGIIALLYGITLMRLDAQLPASPAASEPQQ